MSSDVSAFSTESNEASGDQPDVVDSVAVHMVRLIDNLDALICGFRQGLRPAASWQRQLLSLLDTAERQMLVLRLIESMRKSDAEIVAAAQELGAASRRIGQAIQGSRANATERQVAMLISKLGVELAKLMTHALREGSDYLQEYPVAAISSDARNPS